MIGDPEQQLVCLVAGIGNVRSSDTRWLLLLVLKVLRINASFDGRRQIALLLRLGLLLCVRDLVQLEACVEWLLFPNFARGLLDRSRGAWCS